ncbi:MAG: HlyD family efflux transporter periplasmic adaptor subunit [Armatimonadetes bacterium]|nr:HlyD family efflux transporter periplasmic adaptor subunit [Armatimonadota bacterium]NCO93849.1 HlyD family efflux transporter periplasmic adaptor subunit [Armatimonadota bacterium]NCP31672.1 HlyD family efflux transporter periplasmic adaptor subunit [Armatimonadota bacterium]NDK14419.1 HlyD family efflux transporter periplasmic adaptor subunit [Armatimonadota bacterium]
MKHRKKLIPIALLVVTAVTVAVTRKRRSDDETLQNGKLHGSGTVEATEVEVAATMTGRLTAVAVEEGDTVSAGDLVARLDTRDLKARQVQTEAALAEANANLNRLRNGTRAEQLRAARAAVDSATKAGQAAAAKLRALRNGARPAEKRQAAAAVAQADEAVAGARLALATAHESHADATNLKQQVDAAETAQAAAAEQQKLAQAQLDLVNEGPRKEQIDRARAALEQATAKRTNAKRRHDRATQLFADGAAPKQSLDDAEAAIETADAAVAAANAQLAELQAGARSEEVRQAQAALAQAKANVAGSAKALANARKLYADRLETRAKVETAETQSRIAEQQRKQAAESAALVVEGPRAEEIRAAEALWEQAKAQTRAAQAQLDLLVAGERPEVIAAAEAEVARMGGVLQQLNAGLEDATIVAPRAGTIAEVAARAGEVVPPGACIVRLLDLANAWLKVYFPLTHLGRVKLGQRATLVADTFPDKEYAARVTEVSEEAEFTPKNVQTREQRVQEVFWVKLAIENPNGELKPGMPAEGLIDVGAER